MSTLDVRLTEMDRLLRDIQVELAPGLEPAPGMEPHGAVPDPAPPDPPPPEPPPPGPPPPPPPPAEPPPPPAPGPPEPPPPPPVPAPALDALTELSGRLLASMRELLAGYERVLAQPSPAPPAPPLPRGRRSPTVADRPGATVSAGPFATIEAVRAFESELSRLPGVRDVALRGYEGSDRAIIDVHLT